MLGRSNGQVPIDHVLCMLHSVVCGDSACGAYMRILVTGSRKWDRPLPIAVALLVHSGAREDVTLVHGGAIGADQIAARAAYAFGWEVEEWIPNWAELGKKAGFIRNQHMVDLGADLCIAFTRDGSSGTSHCGTAAENAGIPTIWIYYEAPDA
jgi:hypothetical protein